MKIKQHKLFNIAAAAALLSLGSCGSVFDDLKPCPEGVEMRFVYDYNLESANAFYSQVDCLTLHIYDAEGNFVTTMTETGDVLANEFWRMPVDLKPGTYHAVAYGGIECDKASFSHQAAPGEGSILSDISMKLKPEHIGTRLHDHFHGELDFTVDENSTDYKSVTMRMKKTTNHLRIILQNLDGTPVDGSDFEIYITDDNSILDHHNNPVRGNTIRYSTWDSGKVTAEAQYPDDVNEPEALTRAGELTVGYGELSVSRLTMVTTPKLVIRYVPEQREVASLPLNTYLAMGKSGAETWSSQEYLDRCSRWNLTFFLDKGNVWHRTQIVVNGWKVRINEHEF